MAAQYFDELETMSPESRQRYQTDALTAAVARACEKSPSAREIMDKAGAHPGDIRSLADLQKLPITRKNDLIELEKTRQYGGYLTIPVAAVPRIFISPGPVYEPLHAESIKWFAKSFWAST